MNTQVRLIGSSATMREIQEELECAARSDAKVLLTGEAGVGKEVLARLIHQQGHRRAAPFIPVNCAGVPDSLLESELFGHMRGSVAGAHREPRGWLEQADGGTLFLDEVGEMSLGMQAMLLRFLENGEVQRVGADRVHAKVDVRIISASSRNLHAEIAENRFQEDLYYRLNVIHVAIPALRERKEDLPPLLTEFMRTASASRGVTNPRVLSETLDALLAYSWPGNVRELKDVAERLVIRAQSGVVRLSDLPQEIIDAKPWMPGASAHPHRVPPTIDMTFDRMTVGGESFWTAVYEPFIARDLTRQDLRALIVRGLQHTRGNYRLLVQLFNMNASDYQRFLSFLRKHDCHLPFEKFRSVPARIKRLHKSLRPSLEKAG